MPAIIRVLIVDDHALMRGGVRSLLSLGGDMEVVGEASSGEEALEQAAALKPDVVLMDLLMKTGMSGLDTIRELKERLPDVKVLALTMVDNEEYFLPVLEAGASGYLLKEAEPPELLFAVRAVAAGEAYLSPIVARVVLSGYRSGQSSERSGLGDLTPRQRQVLILAARGNTGREIAERLHFSPKTVEKYRALAMRKLGLQTRAELVRFAAARGLLTDPSIEQEVGP